MGLCEGHSGKQTVLVRVVEAGTGWGWGTKQSKQSRSRTGEEGVFDGHELHDK